MNREIYSHFLIKLVTESLGLALSAFFIISFYFSYKSFTLKITNKIKERFKRLLIPYVIWPIIIYLQKTLFNYMHGEKNDVSLKLLIYQILIGNGIYLIFWFNFNLIFISLFFIIIIFLTKKYLTILILLGLMILFISTSNIYVQFWKGYNEIVAFPIRPITTTYMQGFIGIFLSTYKIIEDKKLAKKYLLFCIFTILILILNNNSTIKLFLKILLSVFNFNFLINSI